MNNSDEGYSAHDENRTDSEKISVQVLGSFSASLRQQIVTPTAGKQRQVFALLALRSGQVVTTSTLAEELWGSSPPPSFAVTLQTYIFQLRRRLAGALPEGQDPKHFLSTRHSGYLLECQTDVEEFKRLARAGRENAGRSERFHQGRSSALGRGDTHKQHHGGVSDSEELMSIPGQWT